MSLGYVEELASRYYLKRGYLVIPNTRFQLDKAKTGKKVSGWSDIDLLAISQSEVLIIQCKSFLGTKRASAIARDIIDWFDYALNYLKKDETWSVWLSGRETKRILVVDCSVSKAEDILKQNDIEIHLYDDLLKELLQKLVSGDWRKGKEDDGVIRLLCAMIDKKLIDTRNLTTHTDST